MNNINPYAPQFNSYQPRYQPQNQGLIWVQGIEGAKAYQMVPGSNAMLLDSENDGTFYIKTADNVGICNLRTFSYTEVVNQSPMANYITRDEFTKAIDELRGAITNAEQSVPTIKQSVSER